MSQEILEQRAQLLLEEWGRCLRKTRNPARGTGPHPIASLMDNYGRRTKMDKRQRWANRRNRHTVDMPKDANGKVRKVQALPMTPERADKQSKGPAAPEQQWPAQMQRVDRALASLPKPLLLVATHYYAWGYSIRTGAEALRLDANKFRQRLEQVRWYVIGQLDYVDADA